MELRQLGNFVALAEEQHFGRAADRLRIASPTLLQQIRALGRDLDVVLAARSSGNRSTSWCPAVPRLSSDRNWRLNVTTVPSVTSGCERYERRLRITC